MDREPTIKFRVDEVNEAHVTLAVFVGRTPDARGHAGRLVLRTDEFADLLAPDVVVTSLPGSASIAARVPGIHRLTLRGVVDYLDDSQVDMIHRFVRAHGKGMRAAMDADPEVGRAMLEEDGR